MAVPVATVATEGMVSAVVEASATAAQAARVVVYGVSSHGGRQLHDGEGQGRHAKRL
jgi:hypothetical protein